MVGRSIELINTFHFGIVSYVSLGNMGVGQGGQMGGQGWSQVVRWYRLYGIGGSQVVSGGLLGPGMV